MKTAMHHDQRTTPNASLESDQPRCLSCRYDLAGLDVELPCPECSMPIVDSLRPVVFIRSNPSDRRHISESIKFLGLLFAAYPWLILFGVLISEQTIIVIVPAAWAISMIVMAGLTRAGLIDPFGVYPKRLIVRSTVIAAIGPVLLLAAFESLRLSGYPLSAIAVLTCLLVPAQCAAAQAFSAIAIVARDARSERRNRMGVWIILAVGLLLTPIYLGPIIGGVISLCLAWPLGRTIGALPYEPSAASRGLAD